jgi:hypothetical protein
MGDICVDFDWIVEPHSQGKDDDVGTNEEMGLKR